MLAGTIANRIFYAGATLIEFKVELIGLVAVMVFAVLGPLLVLAPQLAAAKRAGLREYGTLAQRYAQSLADLANRFEVVKDMRPVPFTAQTVLQLAVATLAPVVPLMLTMISLEQLLERLLTIVF